MGMTPAAAPEAGPLRLTGYLIVLPGDWARVLDALPALDAPHQARIPGTAWAQATWGCTGCYRIPEP